MRKILMMLLVLAMTVCGAVGIAACGKDPDPEQNQGQVEQEKEKEKEEEKPNQNQGNENQDEGNKEEEGKESETPQKPADGKDPETPEEQKPNPENPKDEEQKEEDKQEEEDKKDDKEEEPPQDDEPQGDEPGTDEHGTEPDDEPGKPEEKPDNPTKPDDKPQPQPQPQPEPKPEEPKKECQHVWTYKAYGEDRNSRKHIGTCSKCGAMTTAENCTFGSDFTFVEETCTKDGYNLYTCTVCGIGIESQIWKSGVKQHTAKGHNFGTFTYVDGSNNPARHVKKCTNKGCDYTETVNCTLKAATAEGACTGNGGLKVCEYCSHKVLSEDSNDSNGHLLVYTQLGDNQHKFVCKRTGCNYKAEVENCEFTNKTEEPATCTKSGSITEICKCGRTKVTKLSPTGHLFGEDMEETYKGHTGTCLNCKQQIKDDPHKYGDSNLCLVCRWDGFVGGAGYKIVPGRENEPYFEFSGGGFENASVIILSGDYMGRGLPLRNILKDSFQKYKNLTTVYIPSSVKEIKEGAFSGCNNLKNIFFESGEQECSALKSAIERDLKDSNNLNYQYGKKPADALKEGEQKENTSSAATVFALPAEVGKRAYA